MDLWWYALLADLLIPIIMLVFGLAFRIRPPKQINKIFGYRSEASMRNNETWTFAHKYIGKLMIIIGLILIPFSIIPNLFTYNTNPDLISIVGVVILIIQTIPFISAIILTEKALKKHFSNND